MKFKTLFFTLLAFSFFSNTLEAQWDKTIYAELGGDTYIIVSANYDQRLSKEIGGFGLRTGISIIGSGHLNIPLIANYLFGVRKHFLEVGVGTLYVNKDIFLDGRVRKGFHPKVSVMYRFRSPKSRFMLRFGVSNNPEEEGTLPVIPGLSLGFRI